MEKLMRVTTKQLSDYIAFKLPSFNNDKGEFIKEVDRVIKELTEDGGSPNQLKFFTRVKERLEAPVTITIFPKEVVKLYDPNDKYIGEVDFMQFEDVRVQIKEQKLEGYRVKTSNGEWLDIDKDGRLPYWGTPEIFRTWEGLMMRLI